MHKFLTSMAFIWLLFMCLVALCGIVYYGVKVWAFWGIFMVSIFAVEYLFLRSIMEPPQQEPADPCFFVVLSEAARGTVSKYQEKRIAIRAEDAIAAYKIANEAREVEEKKTGTAWVVYEMRRL